ncbi:DUF2000 domain-containing protein [Clostridium formicaceticum]|uniref:DUF2000 domain-containing protein n=1 Tax=Clostridium formicaceticum TaxID=1497 RepID=A0AAC9WI98_9CLOT|nr:DUF2000 domain-containing protein [Clostridium formicaceticum]AOY75301.1 hypothetical protein BJL90_04910 [Clostridium formicaceticum]ARE89743.1 hypothetical protein CLFO_42240 [Clostridium formicaceticum]
MKCVMIIDGSLPVGIIANTTAALGISLASEARELIGKKVVDRDGRIHEGITNIPIPILTLSREEIKKEYDILLENNDPDIRVIGFSEVAQKSLNYDDYEIKLSSTNKNLINYLGLCLYGPKKKINKLTGNLKMLR